MRFLAATFDHAHPGSQGNYWAYAHPDLATAVLDKFYFEVVAPALRSHPEWAGLHELSGFVTLGARWACWFKRFDVGNDLKGRPGRFVIACAFIERSAITGWESSVILFVPHFAEVEMLARKNCPLPVPAALSMTVECTSANAVGQCLTQLQNRGKGDWRGSDALTKLGNLVGFLPQTIELRAFAVITSGQLTVHADVSSEPTHRPKTIPVFSQISPANGKKTDRSDPPPLLDRDVGESLSRRRFQFFLLGLAVGLVFGFWFGIKRTSSPQPAHELRPSQTLIDGGSNSSPARHESRGGKMEK